MNQCRDFLDDFPQGKLDESTLIGKLLISYYYFLSRNRKSTALLGGFFLPEKKGRR